MAGSEVYGLNSEESLSISDDDSILDFSSSRVTMPLDDQDVRVMQGQTVTRMCEACQLFSKPVCVHNETGIERGIVPYSNGCISRRNGYHALAQVSIVLPSLCFRDIFLFFCFDYLV